MNNINIGLIGYGTVGAGVVKILSNKRGEFKRKYNINCSIKCICDRSYQTKDTKLAGDAKLTNQFQDILNDPGINVVIELIGGMNPAKEIVEKSLRAGKHVITANKELIANCGKELFEIAQQHQVHLYYESSVGAGIPIIKTISEGAVGNSYISLYGIINGTCNFILSEMSQKDCQFEDALKEAQARGYAESDPTLDINGMDSAHKLTILVQLAFGKFIKVKDIHTEGISQISHDDIEHAESLDLTIKLLAIAKVSQDLLEARVSPTLISKQHPLASIHSIYNAVFLDAKPGGRLLLSGEGAGQMAAASGVISDLINLATKNSTAPLLCNQYQDALDINLKAIDDIQSKFYIRFMAPDKPGTLAKITGILGEHGISINSVTQKAHNKTSVVPVVMLTDYTTEHIIRLSLMEIYKSGIVKNKPVALRMEKLGEM